MASGLDSAPLPTPESADWSPASDFTGGLGAGAISGWERVIKCEEVFVAQEAREHMLSMRSSPATAEQSPAFAGSVGRPCLLVLDVVLLEVLRERRALQVGPAPCLPMSPPAQRFTVPHGSEDDVEAASANDGEGRVPFELARRQAVPGRERRAGSVAQHHPCGNDLR